LGAFYHWRATYEESPVVVEEGFLDYNILRFRERLLGVPHGVTVQADDCADIERVIASGEVLWGYSVAAVEAAIWEVVYVNIRDRLDEQSERLSSLEAVLEERSERLAAVESTLEECSQRLQGVEKTLQEYGERWQMKALDAEQRLEFIEREQRRGLHACWQQWKGRFGRVIHATAWVISRGESRSSNSRFFTPADTTA